MKELDWDESILRDLMIDKSHLSEVVSPTYKDFDLLEKWQEKLPFLTSTEFVIGSSDGVLANIGLNAVKKGTVAVTIGTSRSEEHTSELQSRGHLVCRILHEH